MRRRLRQIRPPGKEGKRNDGDFPAGNQELFSQRNGAGLFAAFLLLFAGIYTMAYCLGAGYPNFEYVLANISFTFLFACRF